MTADAREIFPITRPKIAILTENHMTHLQRCKEEKRARVYRELGTMAANCRGRDRIHSAWRNFNDGPTWMAPRMAPVAAVSRLAYLAASIARSSARNNSSRVFCLVVSVAADRFIPDNDFSGASWLASDARRIQDLSSSNRALLRYSICLEEYPRETYKQARRRR